MRIGVLPGLLDRGGYLLPLIIRLGGATGDEDHGDP